MRGSDCALKVRHEFEGDIREVSLPRRRTADGRSRALADNDGGLMDDADWLGSIQLSGRGL